MPQCEAREYTKSLVWRCRREAGHEGAYVETAHGKDQWVPAHYWEVERKR